MYDGLTTRKCEQRGNLVPSIWHPNGSALSSQLYMSLLESLNFVIFIKLGCIELFFYLFPLVEWENFDSPTDWDIHLQLKIHFLQNLWGSDVIFSTFLRLYVCFSMYVHGYLVWRSQGSRQTTYSAITTPKIWSSSAPRPAAVNHCKIDPAGPREEAQKTPAVTTGTLVPVAITWM